MNLDHDEDFVRGEVKDEIVESSSYVVGSTSKPVYRTPRKRTSIPNTRDGERKRKRNLTFAQQSAAQQRRNTNTNTTWHALGANTGGREMARCVSSDPTITTMDQVQHKKNNTTFITVHFWT